MGTKLKVIQKFIFQKKLMHPTQTILGNVPFSIKNSLLENSVIGLNNGLKERQKKICHVRAYRNLLIVVGLLLLVFGCVTG
jgi:hypothetical protein